MNELTKFDFSGIAVRVVSFDGEPWWIASDVCGILGLANVSMALEALLTNEKGISTVDTLGGKQNLLVVSESGLYKLMFKCRKPEAERFVTWITSEVLPRIRKTGSYGVIPQDKDDQLLLMCAELAKKINEGKEMKLLIEQQKPKVVIADAFLLSKDNVTFHSVSNDLKVGRNNLIRFLKAQKILFETNENNCQPHIQYLVKYFVVIPRPYTAKDEIRSAQQTLATPAGIEFIRQLIESKWSTWYPNRNRLQEVK